MNTSKAVRAVAAAVLLAVPTLAGVVQPGRANAKLPPRWVLVGRERFVVNGRSATVPTYVNTNSIEGNQADSFTVTFQARYSGKQGINRVNVGVIVDCFEEKAHADQFYVYYNAGSRNFDRTDGGDLSARITDRALSFCR